MSIEAAIADHAAAIRELAAAIKSAYQAGATISAVSGISTIQVSAPAEAARQMKAEQAKTDAELETAVAKVEAEAKPTTAKAAVQAALAAAKKEDPPTATQSAQLQGAGQDSDDLATGPLSYEKDVQPLLLQVGKNRDQLVELLRKFGAKNGAGIKDSDYPAVVAEAKAIIAARG